MSFSHHGLDHDGAVALAYHTQRGPLRHFQKRKKRTTPLKLLLK